MKLCYEDPALKVSKEPFERPSNLSIVDCYVPKKVVDTTAVEQDTEEFELKSHCKERSNRIPKVIKLLRSRKEKIFTHLD
jgi:hypothetical protein